MEQDISLKRVKTENGNIEGFVSETSKQNNQMLISNKNGSFQESTTGTTGFLEAKITNGCFFTNDIESSVNRSSALSELSSSSRNHSPEVSNLPASTSSSLNSPCSSNKSDQQANETSTTCVDHNGISEKCIQHLATKVRFIIINF